MIRFRWMLGLMMWEDGGLSWKRMQREQHSVRTFSSAEQPFVGGPSWKRLQKSFFIFGFEKNFKTRASLKALIPLSIPSLHLFDKRIKLFQLVCVLPDQQAKNCAHKEIRGWWKPQKMHVCAMGFSLTFQTTNCQTPTPLRSFVGFRWPWWNINQKWFGLNKKKATNNDMPHQWICRLISQICGIPQEGFPCNILIFPKMLQTLKSQKVPNHTNTWGHQANTKT